jgi:hypothetical protein
MPLAMRILLVIRFLSGSIRTRVPPPSLASHSDPKPAATAHGLSPVMIFVTTRGDEAAAAPAIRRIDTRKEQRTAAARRPYFPL